MAEMHQPPPLVAQPTSANAGKYSAAVQWMPLVGPQADCPPGLEYLTQLDQILVQQETHILEILAGWECKNKFRVLNSVGQQVFYAFEESGVCQRMCCGAERGFIYHITDNNQQEVLRVKRDFRWCAGAPCCPCTSCYYYASVETPGGEVLGYISNLFYCCYPTFGIFDKDKNLMAKIHGRCCPYQCCCGCTGDVKFPVIDEKDGTEMGSIAKTWGGAIKDMFTDSDNFRIAFPMNMDIRKKALMFGALFVVDMMLYENTNDDN